jgi:hypothetical protein
MSCNDMRAPVTAYPHNSHIRGRIQVGVGEARSRKKNPLCQSTWLGRVAQPVPVKARPVY